VTANERLNRAIEALRGVTVTIVTPFLPDSLDIDYNGLRRNLEFLAESEVGSLVPAGNTGEFHSLTTTEIIELARVTVEEVAGRKAVFLGVGGDVRTARELARAAQELGADGILLHEPAHTFVSKQGLNDYYRSVCDAIDIAVAVYKRTPRVPDDLLLELARDVSNVVAVKYAWNDVAAYAELVSQAPEGVICACGSAERWALPFSSAGTTGFTSGIANFAPGAVVHFWRALQDDPRGAEAHALWRTFAAIERIRAKDGAALNVPAIKYLMALAGLAGGPPRPPLSAVGSAEATELQQLIAELGVVPVPTRA
jgi:4-hydroxy-tetrahydrodipicolinate synthase